MTHRKYSRNRNRIHKAMARHGGRPPVWKRLEQSARDKKKVAFGMDPAVPGADHTVMVIPRRAGKAKGGIIEKLFKKGK